jgi:hypothetical protein
VRKLDGSVVDVHLDRPVQELSSPVSSTLAAVSSGYCGGNDEQLVSLKAAGLFALCTYPHPLCLNHSQLDRRCEKTQWVS